MIFESFSSHYRPLIDGHLLQVLAKHYSDEPRRRLSEAMQYSLEGSSKRIRPLLIVAVSRFWMSDISPVLPLCSAVEILHTYSLIHDDLPAMDNDDLRRGKPTIHKAFDEATAILAGDAMNTFCFELLATSLSPFPAQAVLKVMTSFSQACGLRGMAGGQMMDLRAQTLPDTVDSVIQIHRLKTGAIIKACVVMPGILYQATAQTLACLEQLGDHIGLLFQIRDDVLDATQESLTLGKTAGKDHMQGKRTMVRSLGVQGAQKRAEEEYEKGLVCLKALEDQSFKTAEIKGIMDYMLGRKY